MFMRLDIKSILILVLLAGCLIFGYMWFFRGDNVYKQELRELRDDNKRIEHERDSINKHLKDLEFSFTKLTDREKFLQNKIDILESEISKSKQDATRSQSELDRIKKKLLETRRKIEEFKDNPPNRTDDDLINSIKIKTMK